MFLRPYRFIAIFILMLVANSMFAQSLTATADRDKILIGEQITLLIKAENVQQLTQWANLPDTINHLEVVSRSKIDTIEIAGSEILQQTITITSFDSGHWQIPALSMAANNQTFTTNPIEVDVLPVDVSQMQDYHDIKEIVEVEATSSRLCIIIIAIITLVSLAAIYWLMKKRKAVIAEKPVLTENLSPLEWALQQLDKLSADDLLNKGAIKLYYLRLTNILRQFFHLQLHHRSLNQTTDEWMVKLQSVPVQQETKTSFLQLLRLADTVKFAKYIPPTGENEQAVITAKTMVTQVAALHKADIHSSNTKS